MTPYEELKEMKKVTGSKKITDLLVLAPSNDPFYVGQTAQVEKAKWFTDMWERLGFTDGVHIRRVHYGIVSMKPPPNKPDGKPYQNTEKDWGWLSGSAKYARHLGFIDASLFIDRRNPDPIISDIFSTNTPDPTLNTGSFNVEIKMPALPEITADSDDYFGNQIADPYMIEIWCEKSTMNDVLVPLCRSLHANFVYGLGELSITMVDNLVQRVVERKKPTRILYVSDFDPAGLSMPVSISRKIEFMAKSVDIKLFPLVLTEDQCKKYELPRTPIKESEKRKGNFENNYGSGATELDALETLYPGELRRIVREAINHYRSDEHREEVEYAIRKYTNAIEEENEKVYEKYGEDLGEAETQWQAIQKNIEVWKDKFEPVYLNIGDELGDIEFDDIELPEPPLIEDHTEPLFDSGRKYMDQLLNYKTFQKKEIK